MRIRNTINYFLFLIVVIGAFASMAQNDYGLKLISWACFGFSLSIFGQLILSNNRKSLIQLVEHILLGVFFIIFGLRASYIYFLYLEWIVAGITFILIVIYIKFALEAHANLNQSNKEMSRFISSFYVSLITFLVSVILRPFMPEVSEFVGMIAGGFLGFFGLGAVFRGRQMVEGTEIRMLQYVRTLPNYASLLLTVFMFISIYTGLNMIGVLPTLYTQKVPQEYIKLVSKAETGDEEQIDGKHRHEVYKEALVKFLERHQESD